MTIKKDRVVCGKEERKYMYILVRGVSLQFGMPHLFLDSKNKHHDNYHWLDIIKCGNTCM